MAQQGQRGHQRTRDYLVPPILHCAAIHLFHLATNSVFEAPREFATPGLVIIEITKELAVMLGDLAQDVCEVFCLTKSLGVGSSSALTRHALHVIGGTDHMNMLRYLSHDSVGVQAFT